MLFKNLKQPRDLTGFNLMTGVTDFGNLVQFNMYEGGYAALLCLKVPAFLETLAADDTSIRNLVNNYKHIIEREFKSLDGLEDITSEELEINDGINSMQVTGKVTMQGGSTFSMRLQEKSGSPITRLHELYLRGIRDPRGAQVKHYHGLIGSPAYDMRKVGFEYETFTFLYINTDNTMRQIEKSYMLVGAQPTSAKTSIYNYEKGGVEFKDVDVEYRAFPISSNIIDGKAQKYLDWLHKSGNLIVNSSDFDYTAHVHTKASELNPKEAL